jgi:Transposase zinc-binding domain
MEVADIFRAHGAAWCAANKGHVSLGQLRAISAIKACRTAALGGHVARCEGCTHTVIGYNSCRNRHCPKCQGSAARDCIAIAAHRQGRIGVNFCRNGTPWSGSFLVSSSLTSRRFARRHQLGVFPLATA